MAKSKIIGYLSRDEGQTGFCRSGRKGAVEEPCWCLACIQQAVNVSSHSCYWAMVELSSRQRNFKVSSKYSCISFLRLP